MGCSIVTRIEDLEYACFLAMPDPRASENLKNLERAIWRACTKHHLQVNGPICEGSVEIRNTIYNHIRSCKFVIAVLTGDERYNMYNPNVAYEIGFAHALGKPIIMVGDPDDRNFPFDLKGYAMVVVKAEEVVRGDDSRIGEAVGLLLERLHRSKNKSVDDKVWKDIIEISSGSDVCRCSKLLDLTCDPRRESGPCAEFLEHCYIVGRSCLNVHALFQPLDQITVRLIGDVFSKPTSVSVQIIKSEWKLLAQQHSTVIGKINELIEDAKLWKELGTSIETISRSSDTPLLSSAYTALKNVMGMYPSAYEKAVTKMRDLVAYPDDLCFPILRELSEDFSGLHFCISNSVINSTQLLMLLLELIHSQTRGGANGRN